MEINWKKNTILFLGGQCLSLFGSMLVQYAIMWHITLKTESGSMITVFILAGILPMFFISPFAGVWADRFNRKYIINIADGSIALATLIVAVFFIFGFESHWLLLGCAAIRALGQGVQTPAVNAFIPQIVPEQHLTKINGINGSIQSLTMLLAPMLSGALLSFASIKIIFFLDVFTAIIGIGIVFFFVKVPAAKGNAGAELFTENHAAQGETPSGGKGLEYFHDLKEGIKYVGRHGFILRLIVFSTIFFIAVSPTAFLTPLHVTRKFGQEAYAAITGIFTKEVWRLTALEIAFSSGMMLGGLLISVWGGFKNRIYTMALATALFGIEAVALGFLTNFWLYLAVMAIMGMTMPLYNTPSMVLLQSKIESAYMGRVFGVFGMVSSLMMPAGMLIFGPLSDKVSIDLLLIVTGIVIFLLSIPFITSKVLREAGRP
ncbi:MAG: MFS transporter [Treponema sp.]|jgi:DHA3 family macrolide efflux protein-like MFS transporter|nr:MFS transporter [Treponema sp.]